MGICGSQLTEEQRANKARTKKLEEQMKRRNHADDQIHKLLLLGAGESGKSTLFKQMISIYGKGFSPDDKDEFKNHICSNIIVTCQELCEQVESGKWGAFQTEEAKAARADLNDTFIKVYDGVMELDEKVAGHIRALWSDPGFQKTYAARANFQLRLNDSFEYYMSRLEAISDREYVPENQDILRCRVKTTGILRKDFEIEDAQFAMFDVGGQRSERKKWIHCFQDKVRAVLFVSAISEYDQVLLEDPDMNRMHESINLFDQIVNSKWFENTSVILFLNKNDLLKKKIAKDTGEFKVCFPNFDGDVHDYDDTTSYIKGCFEDCTLTEEGDPMNGKIIDETVFMHVTCATDPKKLQACV